MNYTIKFVKLSPKLPVAGVGMAGNIMMVINELLGFTDDDNVWVDMGSIPSICSDTIWDDYFNQIDKPKTSTLIELKPPRPYRIIYNNNYDLNDNIMIKSKEVFYKHFTIKEDILDEINNFYESKIKSVETLSCQIRLGDMQKLHNTSTVDVYLKRIKEIIKENPSIQQLFLATDDDVAIDYLKEYLDIPIVYIEGAYRTSSGEVYERFNNKREDHNLNLCKEVIKDIILLGKCDYFLRSEISSVSVVATMLSERVKKIYFLK
jgi:hypothetical protein